MGHKNRIFTLTSVHAVFVVTGYALVDLIWTDLTQNLRDIIGGFPIVIESQISLLITYSLAIYYTIKIA